MSAAHEKSQSNSSGVDFNLFFAAKKQEQKAIEAYGAIDSIEQYDDFLKTQEFEKYIGARHFVDKFRYSDNESLAMHMLKAHEVGIEGMKEKSGHLHGATYEQFFCVEAARKGWSDCLKMLGEIGADLRCHGDWDWNGYRTFDGPAQAAAKNGHLGTLKLLVEEVGAFSREGSPYVEVEGYLTYPLKHSIAETKSVEIARFLVDRFDQKPEDVWSHPYSLSASRLAIASECGLDVSGLDLRKFGRNKEGADFVKALREQSEHSSPKP